MGDDELVNYILRAREKGRTKEQIVRALSSVGWKKERVAAAFQKLDEARSWQQPQEQPQAPAQPQAPRQQPQQQPQPQPEKKPAFAFPQLFGKKQPAASQAPKVQPQPQAPPQQAQQAPEKQPEPQAILQQEPRGASGVLPPAVTFTFGAKPVQLGPSQQIPRQGEPQVRNQAFSNLASAAAGMAAKRGLSPLLLALLITVLAAGAYYLSQPHGAQPPAIEGPHINLTQLQQEKNFTKPPVIQPNPPVKKPIQNATKQPAPALPAPANATPQKPSNASGPETPASNQSGSLQQYARSSRFFSSEGLPPSKFCQNKNAALYRVHYFQYSGADCLADSGQGSYVSPLEFPYACDIIPCCYNDQSKASSRLYDQFECGFYS